MKRTAVFALLTALVLSLVLTACGTSGTGPTASSAPKAAASPSPGTAASSPAASKPGVSAAATASGQLQLTAAELAKYDGKNGNPAYIAVNGVIYDVSKVPQWKNGGHQGHTAGKDLTSELTKSPHGSSVLKGLPIVGKLAG